MSLKRQLKKYMNLTRIHFFFVWPLVFCSGLVFSFQNYGQVSNFIFLKAVLIALFGFEAGFVLNDYVDRDIDVYDVDDLLTNYWRPFGSRPLPLKSISIKETKLIFIILAGTAATLILTLSFPNSLIVLGIMFYSYFIEWFYQIKKRNQHLPIAQLLGRTDFALFPVAGYLVNGRPDTLILSYLLFFYPYTQIHLGLNDIIDTPNDKARKLYTIPVLFGEKKTKYWITIFTIIHLAFVINFLKQAVNVSYIGFILGMLLLIVTNLIIWNGKKPSDWIRALPIFHLSLLFYTLSIILPYFI